MLILPAIDLIDGWCVRLEKGDYSAVTQYDQDPVAVAKGFADEGAEWLHVVDLDGAKAGEPKNLSIVSRICRETGLKVEFGGGLRSDEHVQTALDAGITRAILGTRLVGHMLVAEEIFNRFGDNVVAGLDLRHGLVAIHGWTETAGMAGIDFARTLEGLGARRFIVTDIATDGMLRGPNLPMLQEFVEALAVPVIASGGVSSLADLKAIAETGVEGAIVGKALYERRFTLKEALLS